MEEDIKAMDYKDFLELIESNDHTVNDTYQEIMRKEQVALEAMNAIAQAKQKERNLGKDPLLKMSLSDHYFKLVKIIRDIFTESLVIKDPRDLPWIFLGDDRKIYVGIILVFIAIVVFFVTVSS